MDMRKWTQFSTVFSSVKLSTPEMQVGGKVDIVAGPGTEKVHYTATITALDPEKLLQYTRAGGPLPGTSEWKVTATKYGSELHYTNTYNHELAEPVKKSLSHAMERLLQDIRTAAENSDI